MIVVPCITFYPGNMSIVEEDALHVAMSEQTLDEQFRPITRVVGITDRHRQILLVLSQGADVHVAALLVALMGAHVTSLHKANVADPNLDVLKFEAELCTNIAQRLDAGGRTVLAISRRVGVVAKSASLREQHERFPFDLEFSLHQMLPG